MNRTVSESEIMRILESGLPPPLRGVSRDLSQLIELISDAEYMRFPFSFVDVVPVYEELNLTQTILTGLKRGAFLSWLRDASSGDVYLVKDTHLKSQHGLFVVHVDRHTIAPEEIVRDTFGMRVSPVGGYRYADIRFTLWDNVEHEQLIVSASSWANLSSIAQAVG
jgi:hypothetical protein